MSCDNWPEPGSLVLVKFLDHCVHSETDEAEPQEPSQEEMPGWLVDTDTELFGRPYIRLNRWRSSNHNDDEIMVILRDCVLSVRKLTAEDPP